MGRIMRRIGTGSATQRIELGGTTPMDASDIPYDNNTSVKQAIDANKFRISESLYESTDYAITAIDVDVSSYDALFITLRYYGGVFSTMFYKKPLSSTIRIYGFVDASTNFASASIVYNSTTNKLTQAQVVNGVGTSGATKLNIYGVNY